MGKRVLERVLDFRKETCLIEKLGGLKWRESVAKFLLRLIRDGLEEHERYILPNDGCRLKKTLLLRRQPVKSNNLKPKIAQFSCDRLGTLARAHRPVVLTLPREIGAHVCKDAPYSSLVSEFFGKGFSLA